MNRLTRMVKTESGIIVDDVRYTYDIDGLRIASNDDGIITNYLVDKNRDYGQVLKELDSANTETETVSYLYGDDLIKQTRAANDSYYLYDGHGSARALSDAAGSVTDVYDYSAYGTLIDSFGSTENSYLYAGEQLDSNLDNYYLRARYYDQNVGRFTSMGTWMGVDNNPVTLHKYLYANSDPINFTDPSGNFGFSNIVANQSIAMTLRAISIPVIAIGISQSSVGGGSSSSFDEDRRWSIWDIIAASKLASGISVGTKASATTQATTRTRSPNDGHHNSSLSVWFSGKP